MPSPPQSTEVSLNDRVAAVATVVCDGELHVMNRDPFIATIPSVAPGTPPILVRTFPFEAASTSIVEISAPIALQVPSSEAIDDWAIRQAHDLYNVYVVREDTEIESVGSVLKAQSSIIGTNLSVPVLEIALGLLASATAPLAAAFRERFGSPAELTAMPSAGQPLHPRTDLPTEIPRPLSGNGSSVGHANALPGYL